MYAQSLMFVLLQKVIFIKLIINSSIREIKCSLHHQNNNGITGMLHSMLAIKR